MCIHTSSPAGQRSPRAGTPGPELRGGLLEGIDARLPAKQT